MRAPDETPPVGRDTTPVPALDVEEAGVPAAARRRTRTEPAPPPFAFIDELEEVGTEVVVQVCGATDVGSVRSNNEDALAVVDVTRAEHVDVANVASLDAGDRGILLEVADGMGGENAGEVASAVLLEAVGEHLVQASATDAARALGDAVAHGNARVIEAAAERGRAGMGSTLVAVLIRGGLAYTAEVGDSRAYLLRGARLTQLTTDQTQAQMLVEAGLLTPENAKTSRAKNVLVQACGRVSELVIAQTSIALRQGDRLLLCSDGLTADVSNTEIEHVLATTASLDAACARLLTLAAERGGLDNVTVLVAQLGGALPPPSDEESVGDTMEHLRRFSPDGA
jgi:PPM family protein phosphatase